MSQLYLYSSEELDVRLDEATKVGFGLLRVDSLPWDSNAASLLRGRERQELIEIFLYSRFPLYRIPTE